MRAHKKPGRRVISIRMTLKQAREVLAAADFLRTFSPTRVRVARKGYRVLRDAVRKHSRRAKK
jgi:hypothetical protein